MTLPAWQYWLVGASEGLGRALAQQLAARGVGLTLSARSGDRLTELADSLPGGARVLPMDVTDAASVRAAAEEAGEVEGLVWLAGTYWPMAAQTIDPDRAAAMIDVNLTGLHRLLGHVLPGMLARDRGHLLLTGSLSAYRGLPGAVGYSASKAGVMALAETLRADLRRTGVRVQLANPGFIRTRLTAKNDFDMPQIMEPEVAAGHMLRLMESRRFASAFPHPFADLFRVARLIPAPLWHRLMG
ncbi:SDR family NAD(P)-dependent oxidoreductase [Frigidibacter oleivorans]|uniref:SDR family NAD(P)-dependent oxidoreductase n=1 Tax=Frigidibacter oleivorans TaxID=2487129 RepID=UPI000F8EF3AC|nr:SDR family NAD(P)-dependent oxidoreductase [Frigidibacter oleivorans]